METISISSLKTHLSAELKRVKAGTVLTIVDHKHPVAVLAACSEEPLFVREAKEPYRVEKLTPLVSVDPDPLIAAEREDSW